MFLFYTERIKVIFIAAKGDKDIPLDPPTLTQLWSTEGWSPTSVMPTVDSEVNSCLLLHQFYYQFLDFLHFG